jgi:hypothetical protein
MGGAAAQHNNFWELFTRPAGQGASWKLATPPGVASNGGLVAAATGARSLLTAFRPSQDLTFSPLAATTDGGTSWSQNNVLDAGVAASPGALAAKPGALLALTSSGEVETSTGSSPGTAWSRLTTLTALARTAPGRACGLTALTAAAWTPAGQPLLAGTCSSRGRAGLLLFSGGTWRTAAPVLPAALAHDPVTVLGLATTGTRTTAVLAAGSGTGTVVLTAWSGDGGSSWTLSSELPVGSVAAGTSRSPGLPSVSFGASGSVSVALPDSAGTAASHGATIGWQSSGWQTLPLLPAGTATLATAAAGQPEALAVHGGTLTAWQLSSTGTPRWTLLQTVHVQIPYGSSG